MFWLATGFHDCSDSSTAYMHHVSSGSIPSCAAAQRHCHHPDHGRAIRQLCARSCAQCSASPPVEISRLRQDWGEPYGLGNLYSHGRFASIEKRRHEVVLFGWHCPQSPSSGSHPAGSTLSLPECRWVELDVPCKVSNRSSGPWLEGASPCEIRAQLHDTCMIITSSKPLPKPESELDPTSTRIMTQGGPGGPSAVLHCSVPSPPRMAVLVSPLPRCLVL